jgi:hypothetical protein
MPTDAHRLAVGVQLPPLGGKWGQLYAHRKSVSASGSTSYTLWGYAGGDGGRHVRHKPGGLWCPQTLAKWPVGPARLGTPEATRLVVHMPPTVTSSSTWWCSLGRPPGWWCTCHPLSPAGGDSRPGHTHTHTTGWHVHHQPGGLPSEPLWRGGAARGDNGWCWQWSPRRCRPTASTTRCHL